MRAEIEDRVVVKWLGSLHTSRVLMKVDGEDTDIRVCIGAQQPSREGTCDSVVSDGAEIGSARGYQCRQWDSSNRSDDSCRPTEASVPGE